MNNRESQLHGHRKPFRLDCLKTSTRIQPFSHAQWRFAVVTTTAHPILSVDLQVLYVDLNSRDDPSIYATDYTFSHDLPKSISTAEWAHGLDHRVVRIKLDDAQAKRAQELSTGSVYTIRNLRLMKRRTGFCAHGRLGGENKLIIPLHDMSSEEAQRLQRFAELPSASSSS